MPTDQPQMMDAGVGFCRARNGGVDYGTAPQQLPASMSDSKGDLRSRSESPRRARAAREKYWSYRHVHPDSQRVMYHLDLYPATYQNGKLQYISQFLPVMPSEAPVVIPSKRQLFKQAQRWPRPPRRHHADPDRWNCRKAAGRKDDLVSTGGSTDEAQLLPALLDLEYEERYLIESLDPKHGHGESNLPDRLYGQDGEIVSARSLDRDVDALFEMAEQKHILRAAARRKKLQRQGWDVWDGDAIFSPEPEWEDIASLPDEDFDLL